MPYLACAVLLGAAMLAACAPANPEARFWRWFEANARRLATPKTPSEALLDEVERELHRVDPGLAFEIGNEGPGAPRVLVISADGARGRFPVVQRLVAAAPKVSGWRVIAFRQRNPGFSVQLEKVLLDPKDVWFRTEPQGGEVNVIVFVRDLEALPLKAVKGAVFLLLDATVGEYDVETRIAGIDIQPLPPQPRQAGLRPLSELPQVVDTLKALGPGR